MLRAIARIVRESRHVTNETADKETPEERSEGSYKPSTTAFVIASIFMAAPAAIPFYHALQQDDATIKWVFIAAGFGLVVFNALALVLIYRWLQRFVK